MHGIPSSLLPPSLVYPLFLHYTPYPLAACLYISLKQHIYYLTLLTSPLSLIAFSGSRLCLNKRSPDGYTHVVRGCDSLPTTYHSFHTTLVGWTPPQDTTGTVRWVIPIDREGDLPLPPTLGNTGTHGRSGNQHLSNVIVTTICTAPTTLHCGGVACAAARAFLIMTYSYVGIVSISSFFGGVVTRAIPFCDDSVDDGMTTC